MDSHRASVRAGLVQHEVDALAEFNIGREQILAKWWEFANIDPAKTGYNTTGQSKALDSLWKALGFEDSKKPGEEEPTPDLMVDVYRPPWVLERQRGIFREREESPEPELSSSEPPPRRSQIGSTSPLGWLNRRPLAKAPTGRIDRWNQQNRPTRHLERDLGGLRGCEEVIHFV